jgi:hypothetical protein
MQYHLIVGFPPTSLRLWLAKASVTLGFYIEILTKKKFLILYIENKGILVDKNLII